MAIDRGSASVKQKLLGWSNSSFMKGLIGREVEVCGKKYAKRVTIGLDKAFRHT